MRISEVCKATGLTKKAVEYYQAKGIVNPDCDESGYREFNKSDVAALKQMSMLRALGLAVAEVRAVMESALPREELRKYALKMQLENDLASRQTQLLERLAAGEDSEVIVGEITALNLNKAIKDKLLEAFPGFFGRFYLQHFSQFLGDPITTPEQQAAYTTVIQFLDQVEPPELSGELMSQFEEAMDYMTEDRIMEFEASKRTSIENPEQFLEDNQEVLERYQEFKNSDEYESSPYGQLMTAMKSFGETSGYNDVFIPAMRRLSPSYDEYYQSLLKANAVFVEKLPENK